MKKIKEIFIKYKFQNLILIFLPVGLFFIIYKNIPALTTVLEIPDEVGYLSNAAFFLKFDWDDIQSRMPFYGYGYSVFLIPAFLLCKTGIDLIQSACYLNISFLIIMFFLQVYIIKRLFPNGNIIHFAFAAFVACLNPYLVSNTLKVVCEDCLALWIWILIFFLYKSIVSGHKPYYCLLGIASAYIFFIHARGLITIAAVYLVLFFVSIAFQKRDILKNALLSALIMGIAFMLFYIVKNSILECANSLRIQRGENASSVNLLTTEYLVSRFKSLFEFQNIELHLKGFLARCFYVIYSTGTMAGFGIIGILSSLKKIRHIKKDDVNEVAVYSIKLFFILDAIAMILAATINLPGKKDDFAYFFYNRYYEHTIIPLVSYGICECLYKIHSPKNGTFYCFVIAFTCLMTVGINKYLVNSEIRKDTCRIAGFTSAVSQTSSFTEMIQYAAMLMFLIIIVYYLINYFKISKWFFISLVTMFIWWSSSMDIAYIKELQTRENADTELIKNIYAQDGEQEIYAIDMPSPYIVDFTPRLQALLKNTKLNIIPRETVSSIPTGSYIFIYHDGIETELLSHLTEACNCIGEGHRFDLYQKK